MANTPFLNLVKPADTDQALVSVINSNSDKIDEGYGALSDKIETDTGYQYIKTDGNDSYIMYRKIGKTVMMYALHKISSAEIGAWSNYFFTNNLPQSIRPAMDIIVPMVHDRSGSEGCAFCVNNNGNAYISGRYTGASSSNDILQATVSYIVP